MPDNPTSPTRRSERHQIRMALVLLMDPDNAEKREEAFTVDLSQHGCRIESPASLAAGQLVHLMPADLPGAVMPGRVVWVAEPASELAGEAGIELLQPLAFPV